MFIAFPRCLCCTLSVNSLILNCAIPPQVTEDSGAMQELQLLVQSLTRKVGEAEERYSLLQEQADSFKELLVTEKEQYSQKESMYKQNVGFQSTVAYFCLGAQEHSFNMHASSDASVIEFDTVICYECRCHMSDDAPCVCF